MIFEQDYEVYPRVLIWGESELACRVAVELGRHLPIVWAFPGKASGQALGATVLEDCRLRGVEGAKGDFTVEIESGGDLIRQRVGTIMVFPEPQYDIVADFRAGAKAEPPLTLALVLKQVRPGVFREIMRESLRAVSRGRQVFLAVDEVQVGFADGEELYQEARSAGVIFIKDAVVSVVEDGRNHGAEEPGVAWTLEIRTGALGGSRPWVIEADRVWWYNGDRMRTDYLEVLGVLRVQGNLQEYYPFRTCREGVLVVDPGWGEPFSEEEIIACLKTLARFPAGIRADYEIQPDSCALCLTCYRTCPHQAVRFGQKASNLYGQAMFIDPRACFNCGRCQAECPARAIQPVAPPDAARGTLALACENSGGPLLQGTGIPYRLFPCAGSIGINDMLEAWAPGLERMVIMTCRDGKCRHGSGGRRLSARVAKLNRLIKSLPHPFYIEVMQVSAQDRAEDLGRRINRP